MISRLVGACSVGLLLSATTAAVSTPAGAASETCQGQPATIVGVGPVVTGTAGPDVIVSGGAVSVDAGDGDDLVCITPGATERIVVQGRGGDDSILVEDGVTQIVRTELGPGADTYVGGDSVDIVSSTAGPSVGAAGFGPDDVSTGAGDDVFVAHAPVGAVDLGDNRDRLDLYEGDSGQSMSLGAGDDEIKFYPSGPTVVGLTGTLDAGSGINRVELRIAANVDLRKRTISMGGATSPLLGIQDAFLFGEAATFIGDGLPNTVYVYTCGSKVKGGRGADHFVHSSPELDCSGDAGSHRWFGNQGNDFFEGSVTGRDELFGGPGDDSILGDGQFDRDEGSFNTISGGGGDDKVTGGRATDRVFGGNGSDRLFGKDGNDQLYGGAGRDKTYGGAGRDTCRAEVRAFCER